MFTITMSQGFQIKFENGWAISVQWGPMHYCANKDNGFSVPNREAPRGEFYSCTNAEVAIIKPDGKHYQFDDDDGVRGWCTPDQVASLIAFTSGNPALLGVVEL